MPDEAKNPKKQKAGRLSQKKAKFAAFSAAPLSYARDIQMIIDNTGKTIENHEPIIDASLTDITREDKSTSEDNDFLRSEFSILAKDLMRRMLVMEVEKPTKGDRIWFNGILDKHSGKVISAIWEGHQSDKKKAEFQITHLRTTTLDRKMLLQQSNFIH